MGIKKQSKVMKMEKTSNSDVLCWNFCPICIPKAYLISNFGAQNTKWKVGNLTDIIIMNVIMEQKLPCRKKRDKGNFLEKIPMYVCVS